MKKVILLVSAVLFNYLVSIAQQIDPAPSEKAVVYFVRTSALGFAINFSYFDSTKLIGKFNGPKYIRYECDPGYHLFWVRSENRDFVEADLEAGKVYFIEAIPQMGAIKAAVQLVPLDPANSKKMDKVLKLLKKRASESFTEDEIAKEQKYMEEVIHRGMERYKNEKEKGKANPRLEKNMYYNIQ